MNEQMFVYVSHFVERTEQRYSIGGRFQFSSIHESPLALYYAAIGIDRPFI
jgi:hypothetical protein